MWYVLAINVNYYHIILQLAMMLNMVIRLGAKAGAWMQYVDTRAECDRFVSMTWI